MLERDRNVTAASRAMAKRTKSEKPHRFLCIIGEKGKVLLTFFLHPKMKGSSPGCLSGVHRG